MYISVLYIKDFLYKDTAVNGDGNLTIGENPMRKVLLATTALAAVSAVAAANAEVKLGAYYQFGYSSVSDDTSYEGDKMYTDSEYHITYSKTSDSGLNFSAKFENEGDNSNGANDEASLTLSKAEMGKVILGSNDMAYDMFAAGVPGLSAMSAGGYDGTGGGGNGTTTVSAVSAGLETDAIATSADDTPKATYVSPNLNGLSAGLSYQKEVAVEDAETSMGISYSTEIAGASLSMSAATQDDNKDNNTKKTNYGASVSMNGFSVGAAVVNKEKKGSGNYESDTTSVGVSYQVSDNLVVAYATTASELDAGTNSGDKLDTDSFGAKYTIAPGLTFSLAFNSVKFTDSSDSSVTMDTDEIRAELGASF